MTYQPVYYAPAPPQHKFRALAWVAFGCGLAGTVLIPVPLLNNAGAILGVAGIVMSLIAVFGSARWLAVAALFLSGVALVGTLAIQMHWASELEQIERETEEFERDLNRDLNDLMDCHAEWDPAETPLPPDC